MEPATGRTALGLLLALVLLVGAAAGFVRTRTAPALLQLVGAACLVVVVLTHLAESLRLLPWMGWGQPHSPGHYLDLASALLGGLLFPVGYLAAAFSRRQR